MTPDPLDGATSLLRNAVSDAGDVDALPAGRDVAVARLAEAIRARSRKKSRTRALYIGAAAAGVLLVVGASLAVVRRAPAVAAAGTPDLGRVVDPSAGVLVVHEGRSEAAARGARVAEGTELRTSPSSEARLDFDSGTRVTLGGAARVRLVEQSRRKRFALEAGSLFAKVAKLGGDERFVVATPDAEIEVRGTAFRVTIVPVDLSCAGGTPTRLEVDEGVVVVRHGGVERQVGAGERWPSGCATPAAPGAASSANAPTAPRVDGALPPSPPASAHAGASSAGSTTVGAHEALAVAPESSSRLALQNDLFDDAMRLKRGGDGPGAVAKLERLLGSYPGGPLAESAAVERMRLLVASDRARAAAAARDYLRRHPRGFARAEAEAIAAGAP